MALANLTRQDIRVEIGDALGAIKLIEADATGTTSTFLTDDILGSGADEYTGKWIVFTSGSNNDGQIRRVVDSSVSSNQTTLTFHPIVTDATADGDTAELWGEKYDPVAIHRFINASIRMSYGRVYDPENDISIFLDGKQRRIDIPTSLSMINGLEYRSKITSKTIHDAASAWTAGSNVTVAVDTEIKKRGTASNKFTLAAGVAGGGVVAYKDITSIDLSDYTHIEWWARCSKTTTAADLKLLLDDTAGSVSPIELLDFPILTADTWQLCRVALAKADEDTAIISVGIEDDVDIGAETVWIDDVRAVKNDTAEWTPIPHHLWQIDKENRDIILDSTAVMRAGYNMLKIKGGGEPALLDADATVNEIDDQYVIAQATALAFQSVAQNVESPEWAQASRWRAAALQAWMRFPVLNSARRVE